MNFVKKFWGNDNADFEESYDDIYVMPESLKTDIEQSEARENPITGAPANNDLSFHPASADGVSLKLLKPKSHIEAAKIADKLKEGCIVLLDISNLNKEQAHRLVDFLAGVAYVMNGEMIKTNKSTILVSPSGVNISTLVTEDPEALAAEEEAEEYEEVYEEVAEAPEV